MPRLIRNPLHRAFSAERPGVRAAFVGLASLLLCCSAGWGQDRPNDQGEPATSPAAASANDSPNAPAAERIVIPRTITLRDLVELAASRLAIDVLLDTAQLDRDTVTLRLAEDLSIDRLWELTVSALRSRGHEVLFDERASVFRVVRAEQQAVQRLVTVPMVLDGWDESLLGEGGPTASVVEVFVRPRSSRPDALVSALQPVLEPGGGLAVSVGQSPFLRLKGPRALVANALRLGDQLDLPGVTLEDRFVAVRHITPTEAVAAVERWRTLRPVPPADIDQALRVAPMSPRAELALRGRPQDLDAVEALLARIDQPREMSVEAYMLPGVEPDRLAQSVQTFTGERTDVHRIVADALTGAVIVEATPTGHADIRSLIDSLSGAQSAQDRRTVVYELRHRDPEAVKSTLERLLEPDPQDLFGSARADSNELIDSEGETRTLRARPSGPAPEFRIEADTRLNRLVVLATPAEHAQIRELIGMLDRREPQVMLEIALLTMSESDALSFGAELQTQFDAGQTSVNLASLFGLGSEAGSGALATGTGFTGIVLRPGDYSVTLRALRTVNRGRNISTPMVVTNNNEAASVRSVATRPFSSINASNTVATTSFGGESEAGTTITVTPRIAAGDDLVLRYAVELSAFTGESIVTNDGGVLPPPRQTNTIEGSVTIPDSFTVVVGGLLNESTSRGESRVPVLGQIPLIGPLFGTTSESSARDRFYVFIRAEILRDAMLEDLRQLSAPSLLEANIDDGHPRIAPRWIE